MSARTFFILQIVIILAAGLTVWALDVLNLPMVLASVVALVGALVLRNRV